MGTAVLSNIDPKIKDVTFTINVDGMKINEVRPVLSEEEFLALCYQNPNFQIEQDEQGNIIIMSPVSLDSGNYEGEAILELGLWNRQTKAGKIYSSATLFILSNGEKRMPDAAWVSKDRINKLSNKERKSFARIAPDFVLEIKSPSDNIKVLKNKMKKVWIANGVRLGWLIDPESETAWVYRLDGSEEEVKGFDKKLSGEKVLEGFEFDLSVLKEDV